jgi:hypothetical protein
MYGQLSEMSATGSQPELRMMITGGRESAAPSKISARYLAPYLDARDQAAGS